MRIATISGAAETVDDLRRAVQGASGIEVAWVAGSTDQAVDQCLRDAPDVALLDMDSQGVDGVETTRRMMSRAPCPILLITRSMNENAGAIFEALGAGAIDAVAAPDSGSGRSAVDPAILLHKIEMLRRLVRAGARTPARPSIGRVGAAKRPASGLVAIGASAGGPKAIAAALRSLPAGFPAAVLVVQHMDPLFVGSLATWLGQQCALPARIAEPGDEPTDGTIMLAGTDKHLLLTGAGRLTYSDAPSRGVYRPSIDLLLESAAMHWRRPAVGVLLTGMGQDGALGLMAMRAAGFATVAQSRETCAVYGMPKAAVALGAAQHVLPVDEIGAYLNCVFTKI